MTTTPAFMTQSGYESALEQFHLDFKYWKGVEEKMKRHNEERIAEWKRKDKELEKALDTQAKLQEATMQETKLQESQSIAIETQANLQEANLQEAQSIAIETQEKIQKDHAEIKKYSQQEIDEAIRQIRMERLKKLLNPYV